MITSEEAGAILGKSKPTMTRWRKDGYGPRPMDRIGRSWLYDRKQVEAFAKALKVVGR